ncbi:hypothetical protein WA026_012104 [Henosepilachna vigintioctopunctata]|uniref:Ionotropic receptor n=1 Tax=Henosepilachna vigintioctopunctata TaxID=420089 RepID=A0AAW1V4Z6_9CUCU
MFNFSTRVVNTTLIITQCISLIIERNIHPTEYISLSTDRIFENVSAARFDFFSGMKSHFYYIPELEFYVIEDKTLEDLSTLFTIIQTRFYNMYNPLAKFLIIGSGFSSGYAKLLKRRFITKAVFVDSTNGSIYKMNIAEEQFHENPHLIHYGTCGETGDVDGIFLPRNSRIQSLKQRGISLLFDNKPMYSCTTCARKGIELELLELLLNQMKINYTITMCSDSTSDGLHGPFDILIGSKMLINVFETDYTISYLEDYMKWFVPVDQKIQRWRYILYVFNPTLWISFFLALAFLAIIWIIVDIFSKEYTRRSNFTVIQFILIAFLGRNKSFRQSELSQDVLIFGIIFLSFMIYCFFGTRMTYLLNGINYEKGIDSIEDITNNRLFVASVTKFMQSMMKTIPGLESYPKEKYIEFFDVDSYYYKINLFKEVALLAPMRQTRHVLKEFSEKNISIQLKELPLSYYTAKIITLIARGHPLSAVIRRHFVYALESGIIKKIIETYDVKLEEESTLEPTNSLTISHFWTPIAILIIGLVFSTLMFLLETRWINLKKNLLRK